MRIKFFILLVLWLPLSSVYSQEASFKEKVESFVTKFLGREFSEKIFGKKPKEIALPKIPKRTKNPTDLSIYKFKDRPNQLLGRLTEEQKREELAHYIYEVFQAVRQGRPTDEERREWINSLNQGASREGMYRALVKDDTYAGLENYDDPMTDAQKQFAVTFFKKFFNESVNPQVLEQINVFSLKRICVDKAFDVMDALKGDGRKLDDWYAVASSDLATLFGDKFTGKTRKNRKASFHKRWASKVSIDYLKVEMAIKLHTVLNNL